MHVKCVNLWLRACVVYNAPTGRGVTKTGSAGRYQRQSTYTPLVYNTRTQRCHSHMPHLLDNLIKFRHHHWVKKTCVGKKKKKGRVRKGGGEGEERGIVANQSYNGQAMLAIAVQL